MTKMVPNINNSLFHLAFTESYPSSIFFKLFIQKFLSFYIYTILGYVFVLPFLGKGITYASLLCKTMRSCLTLCHHFLQKGFVAVKMKVISCLHCLRFLDLRAQPLDDQSQLLIQEFTWERCDLNLLAVNVKVIQMGNIYNVTSNLSIRAIFRSLGVGGDEDFDNLYSNAEDICKVVRKKITFLNIVTLYFHSSHSGCGG